MRLTTAATLAFSAALMIGCGGGGGDAAAGPDPARGKKLYELYHRYDSIESIPAAEMAVWLSQPDSAMGLGVRGHALEVGAIFVRTLEDPEAPPPVLWVELCQ